MYKFSLPFLCLFLLISCDNSSTIEEIDKHLKQAQAHLEQQHYSDAQKTFLQVLRVDNDNTDAYLGLFEIAKSKGDQQKGLFYLSKIIEIKPSDPQAYILSGEIFLSQRNISDAQSIESTLLDISPNTIETLLYQTNLALLTDKKEDAYKYVQQVLAIDPLYPKATALEASKFYDTGDYKTALVIIEKSLSENPENINLNQLKIELLIAQDRLKEAEEFYIQLIEKHPQEAILYIGLTDFYLKAGRRQEALNTIKTLSTVSNINAYQKIRMIEYLNNKKLHQDAIDFIRNSQQTHSNQAILSLHLADQYTIISDLEKAESEYKNIIDLKESNTQYELASIQHLARINYAKIKLQKGEAEAAKELATQALAIEPSNTNALKIRAELLLKEKDYYSADADLSNILKSEPDNIAIKAMLAATKFQTGNNEKSFSLYKKFIDDHPNNENLIINYLYRLISTGKHLQASIAARNWLGANSDRKGVLKLYAESLVGLKEFNKLLTIIGRYETVAGNDSFSNYAKAIAYIELNRPSEAIDAYKQSLRKNASNLKAAAELLNLYVTLGKTDIAIRFFKDFLTKKKNSPTALYALGNAYSIQKQYPQAKKTYSQLIETSPKIAAGYKALASIHKAEGDIGLAQKTLSSGLSKVPNSPELYKDIGMIHFKKEEFNEAINAFGKAFELNPSDLYAANNYISLVSDHHTETAYLEKLKPLVNSLKKVDKPFLKDTTGWFYYQLGDFTEARRLIEDAIKSSPTEPVFLYHLGMVYKAQDQKELAKKTLNEAINKATKDFKEIQEAKIALEAL